MTFFKADSSQVNTGFELLPEGKYEVMIEKGTPKAASTGTAGIEFILTIRDDVEGQQFGGRKLWYYLWVNENTGGIVNGFLAAIGSPDGKEFATAKDMADYATGRAVVAVVKHEVYEGKTRERVKYINASTIGGGKIDSPFDDQPMADPFSTNKADNDPFSTGGGPIEVSDDDLPF